MKSLLMNAEMVRAYAEGRKDLTRRLMKPQPDGASDGAIYYPHRDHPKWLCYANEAHFRRGVATDFAPFRAGEQIYIRETWRYYDWTEDGYPFIQYKGDDSVRLIENYPEEWGERLEAIWSELSKPSNFLINNAARDVGWRPSIHMPEWAARFRPTVISIRPERVQEITEEDAKREGLPIIIAYHDSEFKHPLTAGEQFKALWQSLYGQWNSIYKRVNGKRALVGFECYPLSEGDIPPIPAKARKLGLPCTAHPNPWIWRIELTKVTQ